jgi:hypothetical protein
VSKPTRRSPRSPAVPAYDPAEDTSSLSCVRRAVATGVGPSVDHAFDVADAAFDASCADVAAAYRVERPAAVIARYITEWVVA